MISEVEITQAKWKIQSAIKKTKDEKELLDVAAVFYREIAECMAKSKRGFRNER